MKTPYIPHGCDQQGRIEAAHAACEEGMEDRAAGELSPAVAMLVGACIGLGIWLLLALAWAVAQ